MAEIFGANIDALNQLGVSFDSTWAGELEALTSKIDGEVAASDAIWVGPDANQFRGDIWPGHRTRLQAAIEALVQAGTLARNQAQQQEQTSNSI